MGMSASQARYLQLTARKSNVEYQAQQITQARLALSDSTEAISIEYEKALNNRRLYYATDAAILSGTTDLPLLTYTDITNDIDKGGMGMELINASGKIVVPILPDMSEIIESGHTIADYVVDEDVKNSEYLDNCIRNYVYFLGQESESSEARNGLEKVDYSTCTNIRDSLYKDDDAAATAKYQEEMQKVQRQDKLLELNLKQLETQRTALETEMENIKKVIDKNVEVFKDTFGGS